jgi:hypothetical protein
MLVMVAFSCSIQCLLCYKQVLYVVLPKVVFIAYRIPLFSVVLLEEMTGH